MWKCHHARCVKYFEKEEVQSTAQKGKDEGSELNKNRFRRKKVWKCHHARCVKYFEKGSLEEITHLARKCQRTASFFVLCSNLTKMTKMLTLFALAY